MCGKWVFPGTVFLVGMFTILVCFSSCRLSSTLLSTPLTEEEMKFVGSWKHVHGIGNVWNKEFSEDRNLHTYSSNLLWGSGEDFFLWEADGETLFLYDRDRAFLRLDAEYPYRFPSDILLVIDGNEYEKQ